MVDVYNTTVIVCFSASKNFKYREQAICILLAETVNKLCNVI